MTTGFVEPLLGAASEPAVSHVVALTIVAPRPRAAAAGGADDVLVGVRRPECSENHKGIASVPTMRVPEAVFAAIERQRLAGPAEAYTVPRRSEDPVYHAVEAILSRKLGLADSLERRRLEYSAVPCVYRAARSPVLVPGDVPEPLRMINILVRLTAGRDLIPAATASYSALGWFDTKDAVARMSRNEPFVFTDGHRETSYTCGGVCICTAEVLIRCHSSICKL